MARRKRTAFHAVLVYTEQISIISSKMKRLTWNNRNIIIHDTENKMHWTCQQRGYLGKTGNKKGTYNSNALDILALRVFRENWKQEAYL